MTLGALLDVGLGILTIIILFSLAATAIQESIAQTLRRRPRSLEDGLRTLLEANWGDGEAAPGKLKGLSPKAMTGAFYEHPRIKALSRSPADSRLERIRDALLSIFGAHGPRLPSAIPPRVYAETMLDLLEEKDVRLTEAQKAIEARGEAAAKALDSILNRMRSGRAVQDAPETLRELTAQVSEGLGQVNAAFDARVAELETEFNDTMDRVSGWYARSTRVWLFAIGFLLAIGANVDLLQYVRASLDDPELQRRALAQAMLLADERGDGFRDLLEQAEALEVDGVDADEDGADDGAAEAGDDAAEEDDEAAEDGAAVEAGAEAEPEAAPADALREEVAREFAALRGGLEGLGAKVGWRCYTPRARDGEADRDAEAAPAGGAEAGSSEAGAGRGWGAALRGGLGRLRGGLDAVVCDAGDRLVTPNGPQIAGWFLIAFATQLGSQFWFELLKQVLALRTGGKVSQPAAAGGGDDRGGA